MTNNEDNSGHEYASVASDADVRFASARSDRSAAKSGWSGLQICHTQSKSEIREDAHGEKVILLDNGSTRNNFMDNSMVNYIRNTRYKMELATNAGTIILEEESDVTGFGKFILSTYAIANMFALTDLKNVCRVTYDYAK